MPLARCGGALRNASAQCSVVELSSDDAIMVESLAQQIQLIFDRATGKTPKTIDVRVPPIAGSNLVGKKKIG